MSYNNGLDLICTCRHSKQAHFYDGTGSCHMTESGKIINGPSEIYVDYCTEFKFDPLKSLEQKYLKEVKK
jgi:hypothetical protein